MNRISNVLLYREGKILLGKRSALRRAYPDSWALFGGHIEKGETAVDAALRETYEELNITVSHLQFLHEIQTQNADGITTITVYASSQWSGNLQLVGDEHTAMHWFDIQAAMQLKNLALQDYQTSFKLAALLCQKQPAPPN